MDLLRGSHQTDSAPFILKSFFTNNVKILTETVVKILAIKESEIKFKDNLINDLTKQRNTAKNESVDAKSTLHLKITEMEMLKHNQKREIDLLKIEQTKEIKLLRKNTMSKLDMPKLETAVGEIKREVAELKRNNKAQKEQIKVLQTQKESIQEMVLELETFNEKKNTEIENLKTQEESVWEFAAKKEEILLTQGDQIAKLQTLKTYFQAKIQPLDQSDFSLRRKIQRHVKYRKEEKKKDNKALTRLVFKLKAKSWKLKTELNSTIFWFERSKVRSQNQVIELLSKNRLLQDINKSLLNLNEDGLGRVRRSETVRPWLGWDKLGSPIGRIDTGNYIKNVYIF